MGRGGIKRRKRKRRQRDSGSGGGVIADLRDQAAWSSYGQGIPRLGDPRREDLRLARWARFGSGVMHGVGWKRAVGFVVVGSMLLGALVGILRAIRVL